MLKLLRLQNFKGWKDTGTIRMAPITLFFGTNSSGKSSIGQLLMMLKQTVESPDRKAVFYPGGKHSAVQLGSFQEMVFQRDPENKIAFAYQWSLPEHLKIKDPETEQAWSGNILAFQVVVGLGEKHRPPLILDHLQYDLWENNQSKLAIGMNRRSETPSQYQVHATNYPLQRKPGRSRLPVTPVRFYGFPDEVVAYHRNAGFVHMLNLQHEKLFRSIAYLGPLRTKAERLYSWTGIEPESVGYAGENTVAAILAAKNRTISLGYRQPVKPFEKIIAHQLKQMNLIEAFHVTPISKHRQEYEVKLRTKGSREWVDLPDVGFGLSQVLPVLVQCFYAPAGSIILMEQPEVHLHPGAQAALADVMIDVIHSRENGKDRQIQLIIETHSEYFLRRLQRRMAEDLVSQEHVSAYFADVTQSPAMLEPLQIDPFGNIRNWPDHFFGDEMGDVLGQAKAALKKQGRPRHTQEPEAIE
jgi:predicted ATPase